MSYGIHVSTGCSASHVIPSGVEGPLAAATQSSLQLLLGFHFCVPGFRIRQRPVSVFGLLAWTGPFWQKRSSAILDHGSSSTLQPIAERLHDVPGTRGARNSQPCQRPILVRARGRPSQLGPGPAAGLVIGG